jgi:2-dehydro-3-deoxyphosphogluconate aldolase/(4S)-4-hydroxy-2-oxoglutarate aldolase
MMSNARNWKIEAIDILRAGPVVPVIVIDEIEQAVPLAEALLAGGIKVLEVTLRSDVAVDAIRRISEEVPEALVGAGTVVSPDDLQAVTEAGAVFAISPGMTEELLVAANNGPISLIPGISTASELMAGMALGYNEFKFFPAGAAGGVPMLKSLGGPFPQITFCPTGGISVQNYNEYLALTNVACVGGSWLVPGEAIRQGDWQRITTLAREAVAGSS